MRTALVLAACAAVLGATGCGSGGASPKDAAQAYVVIADSDLGGSNPDVDAATARYRHCVGIEASAPRARRGAIDTETRGLLVFASLHSLPRNYHRFAGDLAAVKTQDDGLRSILREVRGLDAKLQRRRFPALDPCAFLHDWRAAHWDTSRFETAWFERHGYKPQNALGGKIGAGVHAVAPGALVHAGVSPADADRFTQLAEILYDGS
jgi:hypothetical protein